MGWLGIKRNVTDALFSEIVRRRVNYICERCQRDYKNRKDVFDTSHYISRGNKRVRWDFENVLALCRGCHLHFGKNPDEHTQFMIKKLGLDGYNTLIARKFRKWNDQKIDEKAIRSGLKLALEEMKKNEG